MTNDDRIKDLADGLISKAKERLNVPEPADYFTGNKKADELLRDFENYPHAFVTACIMDRKVKAERAWIIPYIISDEIGSFKLHDLLNNSERIKEIFKEKGLHKFYNVMSENFCAAIKKIEADYQGDASKIWNDNPSSAQIVRRFLEFEGVGPKIATMAANILVRVFGIDVKDKYSIDISVDSHIKRVFTRMGFVKTDSKVNDIIYRARELYPEYPGIFDPVLWNLGVEICHKNSPECDKCDYADLCNFCIKQN